MHFAHAAAYLMRLAGIPARIATGYLTDLQYAKDGHILLQLGDRHAWPEIYVQGHGWIVVDITPAQAENEPELIPNENLLEELMSKIDPAQEFTLPPPIEEGEEESEENIFTEVVNPKVAISALLIAALAWILFKLWLRFGYHLTSNKNIKIKLAYQAFASLMADLNLSRRYGETRQEYASRLEAHFGINAKQLTQINEERSYQGRAEVQKLSEALKDVNSSLKHSRFRWWRFPAF